MLVCLYVFVRKIGIYRTVKSKGGNFMVKYCMNLSDEKKEAALTLLWKVKEMFVSVR